MDYDDDQIRRILLEQVFFLTGKELCEKWDVSNYRLRKWKKRVPNWRSSWTIEDVTVAGLYPDGWHEPGELADYLDYRNHASYSDEQILGFLKTCEEQGRAVCKDGLWSYEQREPPFIF